MEEHRSTTRYPINGIAEVYRKKSKNPIKAIIQDVSKGGMALHLDKVVNPEEEVTVSIKFEDHDGNVAEERVKGKVAWKDHWENKLYFVSISFMQEVTQKQYPHLSAYLEHMEQEKASSSGPTA
ncbi:MAG TPA: PilZ domain-containing protein [Nitrospiria bacterium]|nr:PilZ domain-containing protein [Nitrospiria bacterium]